MIEDSNGNVSHIKSNNLKKNEDIMCIGLQKLLIDQSTRKQPKTSKIINIAHKLNTDKLLFSHVFAPFRG